MYMHATLLHADQWSFNFVFMDIYVSSGTTLKTAKPYVQLLI